MSRCGYWREASPVSGVPLCRSAAFHRAGSPNGAGPLTTVANVSATLPHGVGPATEIEAFDPEIDTVSVRSGAGW